MFGAKRNWFKCGDEGAQGGDEGAQGGDEGWAAALLSIMYTDVFFSKNHCIFLNKLTLTFQ